MRQRIAGVLLRLACAGLLGACASVPPAVERSPFDQPDVAPAIAVVFSGAPELRFATPEYAETIGGGALAGGFDIGMRTLYLLAQAPGLLLFPATAAIVAGAIAAGAAGGAAIAASTVVPPEQVAAVVRTMDIVMAELRLPERTAHAVAGDLARWTPYQAEVVDAPGGAAPGDAWFASLRERGFGAALDIRVTAAGFTGRGGSDPGIRLFVNAQARMLDTASGAPTSLRGLVYQSPPREEGAWTREGGALARIELERAYHTLAERIVEHFVLRSELFAPIGWGQPPRTCGVVPVRPKLEWEGVWSGTPRPAPAAVQSLTPTLAWEGTPASIASSFERRFAPSRVDDIRYDLRVWKAVDDAPGELAYEREGIDGTEHRIETVLAPGTTYYWSVRVRYSADGKPRATRWSAANVPTFVPPLPFGDTLSYSRAEAETVIPVVCERWDLTPCGCLDFIPRHNLYRFRTP